MNGLKKTLSIMLCVAMIASGSFMAFAEGESNPQNVTVVEGENGGENKEENKDEDKQQSEQLKAAIGALTGLPLFDSLTEDTDADALLAQVQAARAAYDALTEEEKLLVEEAKLNNLLDLEFFFANRPSNTPADAPVSEVVEALDLTEAAEAGTQEKPTEVSDAQGLKDAVEAGGYIKLTADIKNVDETLEIGTGKSVTIDLNNHSIGFASKKNISLVGGNLELTGTGEIKEENPWFGPVIVKPFDGDSSASLTVGQGVTLTGWSSVFVEANSGNKNHSTNITIHGTLKSVADSSGDKGSGVYVNGTQTNIDQCPTITLSSTSNIISEGNGIYAAGYANWNLAGDMTGETGVEIRAGKMDITGGTIVATGDSTTVGPNGNGSTTIGAGVAIAQHTTKLPIEVTISGGTIKGATALKQSNPQNNDDTSVAQVEISVTGGTFEATSANGKAVESENVKNFIKGGSFSSPVDKEHLDESLKAGLYSPSANPDAPYSYYTSVEEAKAAAKDDPNAVVTDIEGNTEEALYPAAEINGKKYKTLKEAIEHVQSGDTIYVLRNVSDAQGISVPSNNNFTIDFQNHTYTLKGPGAGSPGYETQGFQLLKDSNITMKNGTIRVAENPDKIKMIIQNYANLTLENMQIYAQNKLSAGGTHKEDYALSLNNGNVTFKGNTSIYTSSPDVIAFDVYKSTSYPSLTVTFDESYTGTINGTILYDATDAATHKLIIKGNGTLGKIEASTRAETAAKNEGITVSGGRFTAPVNKDYLAPGYNFELKSNDGTYSYYPTLDAAKEAAKVYGGTITNLNDNTTTVVPPSPNAPEKPNGSTGSSSTVQQMEEREKPDPADKKAMEEYNFWMQVKSKIRATAEGKTLRITVKEGIEYMPASVMQTLYECKVGITLYWDGVTIEIPVGKAQPKQALRVYWTKTKLMDLYNA